MEHSPWEPNRSSAIQEIPRILWNPKVHYRIHKCPPPVPILSQLDPLHTSTFYFLKINLNIILPFTPWSPQWSVSLRFPPPKLCIRLSSPHTRYMPRPSHISLFYHPNNIGWAVQIIQLLIMQLPSLPCYLVSSRPKYSPQYPQPAFLPQCERPRFTPIQHNRQIYSSVYFKI